MNDDFTPAPHGDSELSDPELSAQLGKYGEFLRQYVESDDDSGATVIDLGATGRQTALAGVAGSQRQRRRQGVAALAIAASLLALFGLVNVANLAGSGDSPTSVRGENESPVSDAPTTSDGDLPDYTAPDEDTGPPEDTEPAEDSADPPATATPGTASQPPTTPTTATPEPTPANAASAGAPTEPTPTTTPTPQPTASTATLPAATATPTPAPTATATANPAPTSAPTPAPTATPTAGPSSQPSCVEPYELVGTQCLTYTTPTTSEPTCPVNTVPFGDICRVAAAYLPLEQQCTGTVSGLSCITIVAGVPVETCPDGTVPWPESNTADCAYETPAFQGPPLCATGSVGDPVNGDGCYLVLDPPNAAGECVPWTPSGTTVLVGGECRQPVPAAAGIFECLNGEWLWGKYCRTAVALTISYDCASPATPNGDTCELATPLTPQCPIDAVMGADGSCYRQVSRTPGSLECAQGVLESGICVVTGPAPQ